MKTYSIGRDVNCDIVIGDSTDVVSRRHALINVTPTGKMTIIDQSTNGTYVNGIRISQNVPVPVTRKDTISFAHVAKLDWSMVPSGFMSMRYLLYVAIGVVAIAIGIVAFTTLRGNDTGNDVVTPVDSTLIKAKEDSIMKAKTDSLQKDSIEKEALKQKEKEANDDKKKKKNVKKPEKKDTNSSDDKKKDTPKTEEKKPSQKTKQDVG